MSEKEHALVMNAQAQTPCRFTITLQTRRYLLLSEKEATSIIFKARGGKNGDILLNDSHRLSTSTKRTH